MQLAERSNSANKMHLCSELIQYGPGGEGRWQQASAIEIGYVKTYRLSMLIDATKIWSSQSNG